MTTEYTAKENGGPVTEGVDGASHADPVSTKAGTTPSAITLQERELAVYDLLAASEDLNAIHWLVKLDGHWLVAVVSWFVYAVVDSIPSCRIP